MEDRWGELLCVEQVRACSRSLQVRLFLTMTAKHVRESLFVVSRIITTQIADYFC
jgi:hypothetical protein